jgi:hypothetical protein
MNYERVCKKEKLKLEKLFTVSKNGHHLRKIKGSFLVNRIFF